MKLSPHYLKRYKDISMLLLKYSPPKMPAKFEFQVDTEEFAGNGGPNAKELPDDLERLGPTFIKLGQLLSSRSDLLPERYLKPLASLQDSVKPFPYADVQLIVESELGTKLNKAFGTFEADPMAAASLGQVHRAT